jgi:hypothetical protein
MNSIEEEGSGVCFFFFLIYYREEEVRGVEFSWWVVFCRFWCCTLFVNSIYYGDGAMMREKGHRG